MTENDDIKNELREKAKNFGMGDGGVALFLDGEDVTPSPSPDCGTTTWADREGAMGLGHLFLFHDLRGKPVYIATSVAAEDGELVYTCKGWSRSGMTIFDEDYDRYDIPNPEDGEARILLEIFVQEFGWSTVLQLVGEAWADRVARKVEADREGVRCHPRDHAYPNYVSTGCSNCVEETETEAIVILADPPRVRMECRECGTIYDVRLAA